MYKVLTNEEEVFGLADETCHWTANLQEVSAHKMYLKSLYFYTFLIPFVVRVFINKIWRKKMFEGAIRLLLVNVY